MPVLVLLGVLVVVILLNGFLTMRLRRPPEDSPFNDTAEGRSLFGNSGGGD